MQEYQGQPCPVCGEVFAEKDDIVSCPECGTPYHRACWMKTGHCINTALHESGESWLVQRRREIGEEKSAEKRAEEAEQAAERERGEAPHMINGSLYDGVRLNPEDPCIGMDPEEVLDGAKLREVAEFVQSNRFYYLPLFRLMKRTGKKLSFNLLSLICPQFYFANRKMWGAALIALILNTLIGLPASIVSMNKIAAIELPWADITAASFQSIYHLSLVAMLLISVFWSMSANYLYYRYTVRTISGIKKSVGTEAEMHEEIKRAGGTSLLNVFLMLLIQFVLTRVAVMLMMILR